MDALVSRAVAKQVFFGVCQHLTCCSAFLVTFADRNVNACARICATRGAKIGKHWFEGLGTASSENWESEVPRLGSVGSKVLEPLVPRTGKPRFQDWEASVPTFGNR